MFLWFGIYYSTARGFCKKHPLSPAKREKSLKKTSLFPFTRQKLPGGGVPSQSRLPPCQLPQRGSQVCAPPKACAKPSLASPFGGRWCPVGTVQRLVSAAASVGDGRSPLGCITRAGRRECHAKGMTERAFPAAPAAHVRQWFDVHERQRAAMGANCPVRPRTAKSSVAIHRNICYSRSAWDTMWESAKKRYKQAACAVYRENSLHAVLWRLAFYRRA